MTEIEEAITINPYGKFFEHSQNSKVSYQILPNVLTVTLSSVTLSVTTPLRALSGLSDSLGSTRLANGGTKQVEIKPGCSQTSSELHGLML